MVVIGIKPRAVVVDLRGVLANKNFELYSAEKKLFYKTRIRSFVEDDSLWERNKQNINLKHVYKMAHVEQASRIANKTILKKEPILDNTNETDEMQEGLQRYILFTIDHNPQDRATGLFLESMQIWGYTQDHLKTPVYPDVLPFFKRLKELGIPIILTGASDKTVERIMRSTTSGNLYDYFYYEKHDDPKDNKIGHTQIDYKQSEKAFTKFNLLENKMTLFITHSSVSANKALNIGISVIIVVREDYDPGWKKRVHEAGSGVHTVGSLPIIPVNDQIGHDSDPPEGPDESEYNNPDAADLMLHPVSSKITADDCKKFVIVTSLSDIQFGQKTQKQVVRTKSKPK